MRHLERRNDLFPFANYGGHDFALQNQVLDGERRLQRQRAGSGGARRRCSRSAHVDAHEPGCRGARGAERIRHRLQPPAGQRSDACRREAEGRRRHDAWRSVRRPISRHGCGGPDRTPISARSPTPRISLAMCRSTGSDLPMGYTTKLDWRDVDFVKLYVDGYQINGQIQDMAAPTTFAAAGGARRWWRRRAGRRRQYPGDTGCARTVAAHRRHDGDRVRRPHDAVRGGWRRRASRGGDQGGAPDRARASRSPKLSCRITTSITPRDSVRPSPKG